MLKKKKKKELCALLHQKKKKKKLNWNTVPDRVVPLIAVIVVIKILSSEALKEHGTLID